MIGRIQKILFLLLTASCILVTIEAQTKIQVVSRSVNRSFNYTSSSIIQVNGEKAQIVIHPSITNQIKVIITMIAKNPSRQEAETDVRYCNYTINERKDQILIANNFDVNKGYKEISSNLSARIELEIPGTLSLSIRNIYGTIDMKFVDANWNIINDFGQLTMENVKGTLHINSKYGDISGMNINAITTIETQNSDVMIKNLNKWLTIKSQYGNITLEDIKTSINIEGNMTYIKLPEVNFMDCSFNVRAIKGHIDVPKEYQTFLSKKAGEENFIKSNGILMIQMKTTNNNITLK